MTSGENTAADANYSTVCSIRCQNMEQVTKTACCNSTARYDMSVIKTASYILYVAAP